MGYDKYGTWQDSDNNATHIPQGGYEYNAVSIERHFYTDLANKPATEWRVKVEGYGYVGFYPTREGAEAHAERKRGELAEAARNE